MTDGEIRALLDTCKFRSDSEAKAITDLANAALEARAELDQMVGVCEALRDRLAVVEKALREIAEITERKKNCYPDDWREQIAACPECQCYKDHPIQRGICDTHRKPIYAQENHDRHETKILGYRAQEIARAALQSTPAQNEQSDE